MSGAEERDRTAIEEPAELSSARFRTVNEQIRDVEGELAGYDFVC